MCVTSWPDRARRSPRARTHVSGTATLETLLVVSVFILLFVLIVDFALVAHTRVTLRHAAAVGARYAATHPSASDAEVREATLAAAPGVGLSEAAISVTPSAPRPSGSLVAVRVSRGVALDPLVGQLLPNPFPVSAGSQSRTE